MIYKYLYINIFAHLVIGTYSIETIDNNVFLKK